VSAASPRLRHAAPAVALAVLAAVAAGACDQLRPPRFHGAAIEPPQPAPALRLPVAAATPRHTFDLARATADSARAALVFFGYTHCPDVCPTTLHDWVRVKRALGADSARVRFAFVTVDPERDTPAAVARYVAAIDPGFVGLAGTRADVDAVQREWGVASFRDGGDDAAYTSRTRPRCSPSTRPAPPPHLRARRPPRGRRGRPAPAPPVRRTVSWPHRQRIGRGRRSRDVVLEPSPHMPDRPAGRRAPRPAVFVPAAARSRRPRLPRPQARRPRATAPRGRATRSPACRG
jgi:protein SCO1/2